MGVSFSDVKESLTAIRQRLVGILDEVEWIEKYIAELEAVQHGVEPTELPRAYPASELTNEQLEYLLTLGGSR